LFKKKPIEGVIDMRPLIGIPCHFLLRDGTKRPAYGNNRAYVEAIEDAGGISILIPYVQALQELDNILERLDGVLLPGGTDIQPSYYCEKPHAELMPANPQLDELEFALTRYALRKNLPILGICRGTQVLNVTLGGTLYQDVQQVGSEQHLYLDQPRSTLVHDLCLDPQSRMARLVKATRFKVNSLHHQAIKKPGKGVRIVGWAEDNTPEAIEVEGYRFAMGLQCHPEEIYEQVPACARFFEAFVNACSTDAQAVVEEEATLSSLAKGMAVAALTH
jgi:putative glutamine amidotransferase